ncbi:MAG: maf protein [Verrucomicrobiaceae bacterium]|nr:maf protein [Verrucomicrobiaceae bacterium]
MPEIVLASSSLYRRTLLEKLGLPFICASPSVDETPNPQESAPTLVARLATEKAQALATIYPNHLIIGSDQVAHLDNTIIGKPGNFVNAVSQLQACSARRVEFLTGLCVLESGSGRHQTIVEPFAVIFRQLSTAQIQRYLEREQPFDCAGSFKAEGLGIALFERLEGDDPNALIGLPLIRLVTLLQQAGVAVL